ncbi:MAG TPA: putative Fe-S cluster assembly protein SufT [Verrucomicrobiales bacterium]|nr:putative Fe-S cluster assembly protein SufT [Verrucomicrobiales bacterium]
MGTSYDKLQLTREVEAIQIPSGNRVQLPAGTQLVVTQRLGGSYTVATDFGLARIAAENADALGIDEATAESREAEQAIAAGDLPGAVWAQLKQVYDPEIPVNIVDLGLVYDCRLADEEGRTVAHVKMTLTAPGCGMGPTIAADARSRILGLEGIDDAEVDLVWDPPWNQDMISEEGRMKLGMI